MVWILCLIASVATMFLGSVVIADELSTDNTKLCQYISDTASTGGFANVAITPSHPTRGQEESWAKVASVKSGEVNGYLHGVIDLVTPDGSRLLLAEVPGGGMQSGFRYFYFDDEAKSVSHELGSGMSPPGLGKSGYAVVVEGRAYLIMTSMGNLDVVVFLDGESEHKICEYRKNGYLYSDMSGGPYCRPDIFSSARLVELPDYQGDRKKYFSWDPDFIPDAQYGKRLGLDLNGDGKEGELFIFSYYYSGWGVPFEHAFVRLAGASDHEVSVLEKAINSQYPIAPDKYDQSINVRLVEVDGRYFLHAFRKEESEHRFIAIEGETATTVCSGIAVIKYDPVPRAQWYNGY